MQHLLTQILLILNAPYPPTVPFLEGQSRFLLQNLPLSCFFTAFLDTNLPLDLIIFSYFCQICKNVPLLDQKSHFFRDFVPLFASGRLVGMMHACIILNSQAIPAYACILPVILYTACSGSRSKV